jgi:hypothetical protein
MTKHKEDPEQIKRMHSYRWKTSKSGPWMRKEEKPIKGQPLEKYIT